MIYRLIAPDWALQENPNLKKVIEGEFTYDQVLDYNELYYNCYYLPNYPSIYSSGSTVSGNDIDTFQYVFVDMDLKDNFYKNTETFLEKIRNFTETPTSIVLSGNGVHAYWKISDLDPMSYLQLQRRLCRYFHTDEAVSKIYQLMRVSNTVNTKYKDSFKSCVIIEESGKEYSCEQLSKALPQITHADDQYCKQHFDKTYNTDRSNVQIVDKLPLKFADLIRNNQEVRDIWSGGLSDRSKGDYRLGHIMFASQFSKDEAASVLVNSPKALARAPIHRITYATNIIDKIWTFEVQPETRKNLGLSQSVTEILSRSGEGLKGTRLPCWSYLDATEHGFRLGQVIGLVAGSGVGKTAVALNMFQGFVQNNPDYDHFFIPLEQPVNEIADRWKTMCGENTALHDKVHLISNYDENGAFRALSLSEIKDYIISFQQTTGKKIGCVVIDHIGALKKKSKEGENQGLMDLCHEMKAFAIQTNTLLVMQSQSSREKAGIGDLEIGKDAAYGTMYFEAYCDYLITIWQPLKRCYNEEGCPTVTAFKFCKIRHKKAHLDHMQEDVPYRLLFDSSNEKLRELTQLEEKSFEFFNNIATNKRKKDRKTDVVSYQSIAWTKEELNGKANNNSNVVPIKRAGTLPS